MSFSKEDRKKVFNFFVKILKTINKPVHYENLRGFISEADPVIKKYVKEHKGRKLFEYFENRKNYFVVDSRDETVALKVEKDYTNNSISYEELTSNNSFDCSRSNSVSSRHESISSSVDDVFVPYDIEEMSEYEEATIEYFSEMLALNRKLNLDNLVIKCLPINIQYYVCKYYSNDITSFLKNNPAIFYIDNENSVSLISVESPENFRNTSEIGEKTSDNDLTSVKKFINCADFFFNVLKKKPLKLNYLRELLSPNVSEYLNSNYSTYEDFLRETDALFVLNENEVEITKNCSKLLIKAKKLLNSNVSPEPLKRAIFSQFKSGTSTKQNSLHNKDKVASSENLVTETLNIPSTKSNIGSTGSSKSAKNKKNKVEKLNIPIHESINVESIDFDKKLKDKFKNESFTCKPIMGVISKENIFEVENQEFASASDFAESSKTVIDSDESEWDKIMNNTQTNFIKSVFTVQLLSLEVVEKELILCLKYEYESVKFFVETLENLPEKISNVTSLKGSLGQASKNVKKFIGSLFKGEKINLFFQKYNEFDLDPQTKILKLSSSCKKYLEDKRERHQRFIDRKKVYNVYNLYDSHLYSIFIDILDCLRKFCCFLQNKSQIKFSRLSGVFSKLTSSQQSFINSLNDSHADEKLRRFLCYFNFFNCSDDYIELDQKLNLDITLFINLISEFTQKLNEINKFESKVPYFNSLLDYLITYENDGSLMNLDELSSYVVQGVQNKLNCGPLDYSNLPCVVGYEVLHNLVLEKKDSQFLIQLLEENSLFLLSDGEISFKEDNDESPNLIQDSNSVDEMHCEDSGNEKSQMLLVAESTKMLRKKDEQIFHERLKNSGLKMPSYPRNEMNLDVNEICHEDSEREKSQVSLVAESTEMLQEKDEQILNESSESKIFPYPRNERHLDVNEVGHEDLKLEMPKKSSFSKSDSCICAKENELFNEKLINDDEKIAFNKSKFLEEHQNILKHASTFIDVDVCQSSASPYNKKEVVTKGENNETQNPRNLSEILSTEKTALNVETDNKISCVSILNMQDADSVPRSYCISEENIKIIENLINESNERNILEKTNLTSNRKNALKFNGTNFSESNGKISKTSCLSNSFKENLLPKVSADTMSLSKLINENAALNFESNQNDSNQIILSEAEKQTYTNPIFNEYFMSKNGSTERDSKGDSIQSDFNSNFLQSFEAKIIVLTFDSCIAEAVINGYKKCIFCLKSCFHCGLHSLTCSDCFNSLTVGDEVSCYIPPTENICSHMCFAFMFHKNTKANSVKSVDTEGCQTNQNRQADSKQTRLIKKESLSNENDITTPYRFNTYNLSNSNEYQIDLLDEVKLDPSMTENKNQIQSVVLTQNAQLQSSIVSQSTQVQPSVISQNTQTVEESVKKCHGIKKECQAACTSVSQTTQNINVNSEIGCQTDLVGEVKPCPSSCEKGCLTKFTKLSQNTQTVFESIEQGFQTHIIGNITPQCDTSSCECQTELTGQVQKCASVSHMYSQTLCVDQISITTQTEEKSFDEKLTQEEASFENGSFNVASYAFGSSFQAVQKTYCNMGCQTCASGQIMYTKIYHDD